MSQSSVSQITIEDAELSRLLDISPDAILIADEDGRILIANRHIESLFGIAPEGLIGEPVECLMPQRYRAHHGEHRAGYMQQSHTRPMGSGLDLFAVRADGSEFPVEISLSPLTLNGRTCAVATVRDVTDRKQAQLALKSQAEALQRSNAELEQFAYIASHDLQEPLRMIGSYVQLLERRYKGKLDQEADEFIHYIVDGAKRMQNLINDLLAFSRVGTSTEEPQPTDTRTVVNKVVRMLALRVEELGGRIDIGDMPVVMAEPAQLSQLFQNLIGNALKFHGQTPPVVSITAEQHDGMAEIQIADNGIGMDPQYLDKIFIMFQRLHGKGDYPGTGIGLAICKKIVERNGGQIGVTSRLGEGSQFRFTLPLAAA